MFEQAMPLYYTWMGCYVLLGAGAYFSLRRRKIPFLRSAVFLYILLFFAAISQIALSAASRSNETDMRWFQIWANDVFQYGFGGFYENTRWVDYPPGYLPVLYVVGFVENILHITTATGLRILYKLPVICCDLAGGALIFYATKKHTAADNPLPLFFAALYVFNPALAADTALWGQLDGVTALLIAASFYFLYEEKLLPSALLYTLAFLCKPQALLFFPVYLLYIFAMLAQAAKNKNASSLLPLGKALGLSLLLFIFYSLLFQGGRSDWFWLPKLYLSTMTSYGAASMGAMNFYGLFGLSGQRMDTLLLGMPAYIWSGILMLLSLLTAILIIVLRGDRLRYISAGITLYILLFTFATGMHERYLAPALLLLLLLAALKQSGRLLALFFGCSAVAFFCVSRALVSFWLGVNTDNNLLSLIFSGVMVLSACLLAFFELRPYKTPVHSPQTNA